MACLPQRAPAGGPSREGAHLAVRLPFTDTVCATGLEPREAKHILGRSLNELSTAMVRYTLTSQRRDGEQEVVLQKASYDDQVNPV